MKLSDAIRFFRVRTQWLGDGGQPVPQEVAQLRANTCLLCTRHTRPVEELLTKPIASIVKRQIEMKSEMHLHVDGEAELHTCGICHCYMPLKVWVPLPIARDNTPDWPAYPVNCWLHGQCDSPTSHAPPLHS